MFGAIFVARTAFKCPGRAADAVQWGGEMKGGKKLVDTMRFCGPSDIPVFSGFPKAVAGLCAAPVRRAVRFASIQP